MIHRTRSFLTAVAFAALAMSAATGSAHAQGVPWACAVTTVCNLTNCQMTLNLLTTPAGAIPAIVLAPGQCLPVPTGAVVSIDWVVSGAGFAYPVVPPPPAGFPLPPTTCTPTDWHVDCVALPAATCCADICFDPLTCTININPALCAPGCCRP